MSEIPCFSLSGSPYGKVMKIIFLTRFHSHHTQSGFMTRMAEEAVARGHELKIINPAEVVLRFGGTVEPSFPVSHNGGSFPEADLVLPSARWDDTHTWQIVEALQSWGRNVATHNRVPLGDHVTMMRLFSRRGIPAPRTWVLSQAEQVGIILPELVFPCLMRSRYGGSGRKLIVVEHSGEAFTHAQQLSISGQPFVMQDLPQPLGEDIRILVVGEKIEAAIHRTAPEGFVRPRESGNRHVSRVELTGDEMRVALAAAQLYGGPFCTVSLLRSQTGPVLLEVARAPTLEEMENATGQNLAQKIIDHLTNTVAAQKSNVVPMQPLRGSNH